MNWSIPKQYQIGAHTREVWKDPTLLRETGRYGEIDHVRGLIKIQSNNASLCSQESIDKDTFLHEVVHDILWMLDQRELNKDEAFVNTFASLLNQVISSMTGSVNEEVPV